MAEQKLNLWQKLVEVKKHVEYLQKGEKGYQYNYVSSSKVISSLRDKMNDLNLILEPSVTGHKVTEDMVVSSDKNGQEKHTTTYFTEIDMNMTWINADNPDEKSVIPWYAQGVDTAGEKGVGKAYTYAEKYFLLKYFNIPTDKDDPDAFQHKNESAPAPRQQQRPQNADNGKITQSQRKSIDAAIKAVHMTPETFLEIVKSATNKTYADGRAALSNLSKQDASKVIEALVDYKPDMKESEAS